MQAFSAASHDMSVRLLPEYQMCCNTLQTRATLSQQPRKTMAQQRHIVARRCATHLGLRVHGPLQ